MTGTVELRNTGGSEPGAFDRVLGELEQAQVAVEDLEQRLDEAVAANRELEAQLREERRKREAAERQLAAAKAAPCTAEPKQAREAELRRQLSITLEELQVMAEELEFAQGTIRRLGGGN